MFHIWIIYNSKAQLFKVSYKERLWGSSTNLNNRNYDYKI